MDKSLEKERKCQVIKTVINFEGFYTLPESLKVWPVSVQPTECRWFTSQIVILIGNLKYSEMGDENK
jgi:hypothetical protein